jgi:catalase
LRLRRLKAFAAAVPNGGRFLILMSKQQAPLSFAQTSFRPLHAFRFVNAAGGGRWARYHWEPEAGVAMHPLEELAKQPGEYLYEEIERRLSLAPVAFRLELEMAQEGDPIDDPSALWPEGRERVVVGRLEVHRPIAKSELGNRGAARRLHGVARGAHRRVAAGSARQRVARGQQQELETQHGKVGGR